MSRKRRSFSASFKAKVALEAVKGLKSIGELAKQHQVHPTQIALWKRQLLEGAEEVFEGGGPKSAKSDEPNPATCTSSRFEAGTVRQFRAIA